MAKEKESKGKVRSMEIRPHGKEGFEVTHHHESPERGQYIEPKTHIMKGHGELLHHVHETMGKEGSKDVITGEADCPICGEPGGKEKDDEKEEEA